MYNDALVEHYVGVWKVEPVVRKWTRGPVHDLPGTFRVLEFPPGPNRSMWTYATCGMSSTGEVAPVELFLLTRDRTDRAIELLYIVTHYHRTGARLGLEHTVNFGQPWLPKSKCDHGLISLPYLDGPKLENFVPPTTDFLVQCLWLIPITKAEREFKKANGLDALESRFESTSFDYLDPERPSVV